MKTSISKRFLSLLLTSIMLLGLIPSTAFTFAADESYPVMDAYNAASSGDYHRYYNKVVSVTFLDTIDYADINSADTVESWDVSANDDASVMAWMKLNEDETQAAGTSRYDVFIGGEGGVGANPNSSYIFYSFSALKYVNGLENFKTGNATTFYQLFGMCKALESVDMSSFDTSNVTNLGYIFYQCENLLEASFDGWDTSKVANMSYMFYNCHRLTVLDLSSFDTSKVTTMKFMFYLCRELLYIYAGDGWTTESIINLNDGVFNCCYAKLGGEDEYNKNPNPPVSAHYAALEEDGGYLTYKNNSPEPERYTVTYKFIGDIVPEGVNPAVEAEYEDGTEVIVEESPSAEGYVFSGWSTQDADISSGSFIIHNDVTIVGSWEKLYNVYYEYIGEVPEGAPTPGYYTFKAGEAVTVDSVPFVEGYVFVGWDSDDVTATDGKFLMPSNDVTLYGYFKKPVESVEINGGDITLNKDGETVINVTVKPEDATIQEVVFESDNEAVVKVDENGKVTAVGEGTATITVYSKDDPTKKDTITVTVKTPVEDITVDRTEITLNKNETDKITATVTPDDATDKEVIFESADETIATVDPEGNITAVGEGTTTITVTSKDDPTVTKTVEITVKIPVTEITATDDFTLDIGEEKNVEASVNEDATNKELIYDSSNPGVAKVDPDGNVIAVGEGTTIITVTSKDDPTVKTEITVTVEVSVENIIVDKEDITLDVGESDKVTVTVTPDNATDKEVIFESADETIATVDPEGNITAVGEGTTIITVTSKDDPTVKTEITVTVEVPVENIIVDKEDITLDVGESDKITVTVTPDNATDKEVIFESADETIATVDPKGNITAVGEGTTIITVTSKDDPTVKTEITVTVEKPVIDIPVEDIIVDKEDITLDVGESDKVTVTVTPDNATDKEVIFESADETIATVDPEGNITAVGEGTTIITVTSKDDPTVKTEITVTVEKPVIDIPVEDIIVDKEDITLDVGESDKITVTVTPDNATDKEVIFESADETIATVDPEGNITAVGEGTTTITVTSKDDPTVKTEITVTVEKPVIEEPEYVIEGPDSITVTEKETVNLGVKVTPEDGAPEITYTSSDESIVTVDKDGNITAIGAGTATITADIGNGNIKLITVTVNAIPAPPIVPIPVKHHVAFGKTDGIGWYEVSVNGGDFFPQGPNSTLEVEEGSVLVVRVQDMWIDDEFDFYVNGKKVPMDPANTITVVVDGYMLIGALSMDVEVPDVDQSLTLLDKIKNFFVDLFNWIASWFK